MMRTNLLIKGIAVLAVIVLLAVLLNGKRGSEGEVNVNPSDLVAIEGGPLYEDNGLSEELIGDDDLRKSYGVDVDSPIETMRTLTNETRAVREDSVKLQEENEKIKQETEKLLKMRDSLETVLNSNLEKNKREILQREKLMENDQNLTRNLIKRLENELEGLKANKDSKNVRSSANGYDIGSAGIPSGLGYDENGEEINYDQIVWTNPLEATIDPKNPNKMTLPDFEKTAVKNTPEKNSKNAKEKDKKTKAYTIPINGTLLGSVSLTAMLGRIPTNGQVVDPYPFKVMIGEENLSSNGIRIPGVVGIKMSGFAKGDWTLSCVSGEINSMTFTFADGSIVTYPEPEQKAREAIAWFSDRNGIPCITGKRITNAVSYLSSRVGLTASASYANAKAASQYTTQTNNGGGLTSGVTGDPGIVAQNTAISSGLNEVTDWLDARQNNSFDAIYVPPGTEIAVHITDQINIDYDPEGRKVNHYANINRSTDHHLD